MLFVLFQLGENRCAIEAKRVAEVLPLMPVKPLPPAPPEVAGVLSYRGVPLPVIDLSRVTLGRPAAERLSTRILVIQCSGGKRVGFIAERANETMQREPADFAPTGVNAAAYLGPVAEDARGFVQWIDPDRLIDGAGCLSLLETL